MSALKVIMLIFIFISQITLLTATSQAGKFDAVRDSIQSIVVQNNIPSIAVAVAHNGQIIWEEGFGWANREKRIPATEHTMYSLASISKPITATGIMILVEREIIDLDRPINEYLGHAKLQARVGKASNATVRRVASHTAGLPLHYQFFYEDEPYQRPSMDETIRRYGNLVTAPGERFQYSNLGYGVLDYVISRMSEKSYAEFMRTEVFLPLGMTNTSVDIGPGLEAYQAVRYAQDGIAYPFYDFDHPGGSAIYSSAHDLIRFAMFHLKNHLPDQKCIISDATIDQMHKHTGKIDKNGYGIGWGSGVNKKGLRFVRHSGSMGGVRTTLTLFPDENLAIAILSNASSRWPSDIAQNILETILPEKVEKPDSNENNQSKQPFKPDDKLLGVWKGYVHTYQDTIPLILEIKESGDIHAKLGKQLWTLLNDVSFQDGFLKGLMVGDIQTEDANRRPYNLHLEVKYRGKVLNGSLIAISRPAKRDGNALTQWVELTKE